MQSLKFNTVLKALVVASCIGVASNASAATVSFANFDDNDGPLEGYDADATAAGAGSSNTLNFVVSDFTASSSAGGGDIAFDQLSFDVIAPAGYVITGFSVYEVLLSDTEAAGSVTGASLSLDINGTSFSLGSGVYTGGIGTVTKVVSDTGTIDIASAAALDVSIDNNLFAANGGTISKAESSITFQVAPVPLPPAVWLFGSALIGLATVARTRSRKV